MDHMCAVDNKIWYISSRVVVCENCKHIFRYYGYFNEEKDISEFYYKMAIGAPHSADRLCVKHSFKLMKSWS